MSRADKKIGIICVIAFYLGVISVALAIAAEANRLKESQVKKVSPGVCSRPTTPAYALGMASAFSLLAAQLVITFVTSFISCCTRSPSLMLRTSTTLGHWIMFFLSWLGVVIAFLTLLVGATLNNEHAHICQVMEPWDFPFAALVGFMSVILSICIRVDILVPKSPSEGPVAPIQINIAMGQPQVHPADIP